MTRQRLQAFIGISTQKEIDLTVLQTQIAHVPEQSPHITTLSTWISRILSVS
ncbi:hypothetical protein DSUL_150068 [Desulfovibrionales bacterium]